MPLRSDLFRDDPRLQACLEQDPAHVTPGSVGDFVVRIQLALRIVDNAFIDDAEFTTGTYGQTTTLAVRAFKTSRNILNFAGQIDDIVGKKTIRALDDELVGDAPSPRPDIITRAFADSRASLSAVQTRLLDLQAAIDNVDAMSEPDRTVATAQLLITHARNIQVLSRRLVVSSDPFSAAFRDALAKVIALVGANLSQPVSIRDDGSTGRCAGLPFAATTASDPDPKVSVCDPFFTASRDLQRDVLTHEYFHVLGLGDNSVANTAQALTNANTIAQVVALLHDRFRQANSDGNEPAIPPFVSP